ncbi:zincin [Trichodelitschia bisporula]|uniref:Zincin n=1 Tax=Trichodelitschia bisporula TaxID=703511 RepID=A0A6G1I9X4_9PEZI|nr:zincin [Trichodelitschia bisporula]
MNGPGQSIVSPHLLDALATSEDPETRRMALNTLTHSSHVRTRRRHHLKAKIAESSESSSEQRPVFQGFVPDQLLDHVATSQQSDEASRELAKRTLNINQKLQGDLATSSPTVNDAATSSKLQRRIFDMKNIVQINGRSDETYKLLPGTLVRSEGDPPVPDEHANQVYDNSAMVLEFYQQVFGYNFLDDLGAPIISSIHYENGYQNAQWVGDLARQMIYGDGGSNLYNFTACLDIIGHEMAHAVTEYICPLEYEGESGALNEHVSDAFGMMVTLWADKKTTAESDWLIGEGSLMPGVKGIALRNMKFPGTAYDDPKFGKDPQPASWAEIEAYKTKHVRWNVYDHGSVHAFSGVPNRAFVLAAESLGGYCWETAGKVWWTVLKGKRVSSTCTFVEFADATVDVARELLGEQAAGLVRNAWDEVGVKKAAA